MASAGESRQRRAALEAQPGKEAEQFLAIARVVRPQGRKGEVVAEILTDFPSRFRNLRRVFLENPGGSPYPIQVDSAWPHKGRIVFKFSQVHSIEQASRLRGLHVLIPREERVTLPANAYYVWELVGCQVVVKREGKWTQVGTVTNVEPTGGTDLLHVATPRGEVLVPLAEAICTEIDTEAKRIVIDPPEDLLDLNAPPGRRENSTT